MNVASIEPCQELYELSGWGDESEDIDKWHFPEPYGVHREDEVGTLAYHMKVKPICPAYDSGYLLRKLPATMASTDKDSAASGFSNLHLLKTPSDTWLAGYYANDGLRAYREKLEDALCELAIQLFKEGILKR